MFYITSTVDMIDLGIFFETFFSQIFGRIKLHKKRSRNRIFYLTYESYREFEVNFLVLC